MPSSNLMTARDKAQAEIDYCTYVFYATGRIITVNTSTIWEAQREGRQEAIRNMLRRI